MKTKYTKEILSNIVQKSNSINEVLKALGLKCFSGNHTYISGKINYYEIDISHFVNKKGNIGKPPSNKKTADSILIHSEYRMKSRMLKRALLEKEVPYICKNCGLSDEWNNKKLILQIDHIDGNNLNNQIENLRFLCPNCHSQTETYNRNKTFHQTKCSDCGRNINKKSKKCFKCFNNQERISSRKIKNRPSKEDLQKLLWQKPTTKIAEDYGVSDKAIEKWAKQYNINKPPRGYWTKNKINFEMKVRALQPS